MTVRARVSAVGRRSGRRGFSMIELLAVVLVLGLTFVIASVEGLKAIQKQRLASAASDLTTLMSRAPSEMQTRGTSIFVVFDGAARQFQLVADTNQDNVPDTSTDAVIQTLTLPGDIAFSTTNAGEVQSAFWSANGTSASTVRWLGCDLRTRTFASAAGQIAGIATLSLTHTRMVGSNPALKPPVLLQVRVSPVWSVQANRSLY